jgi:hypothetical protein
VGRRVGDMPAGPHRIVPGPDRDREGALDGLHPVGVRPQLRGGPVEVVGGMLQMLVEMLDLLAKAHRRRRVPTGGLRGRAQGPPAGAQRVRMIVYPAGQPDQVMGIEEGHELSLIAGPAARPAMGRLVDNPGSPSHSVDRRRTCRTTPVRAGG